ncbi:anaerobic sulfite reductase subunit AsrB [Endozoicomonas sp. Mp262]|uniref:anaerobic sulfite reductase subunit AsrB n=1 Tax=Endozoicomonas sp. Mp262 TaxID=2919499 RepID=UPI0021D94A13
MNSVRNFDPAQALEAVAEAQNHYIPRPYTIEKIIRHTPMEWTFRVPVDFEGGFDKFVEVSLPLVGECPISISDFGEGWVELVIRNVGKVTSELFELQEGDTIFLRGPMGNGYPVKEEYIGKNLTVIAGGTGVAPARSVINYFMRNRDHIREMNVIVGFRNRDMILFHDDISVWQEKFNTIVTLDNGDPGLGETVGLVTAHLDKINYQDPMSHHFVVVGPPMMIHCTVEGLLERGAREDRIWVSHERRMACAVGKCGHCRVGDTYICIDGPVFRYDQAKHLVD